MRSTKIKVIQVNPGQYHEVNPGQYHEVNPGQPLPEEQAAVEPAATAADSSQPKLGKVQLDVVKSTDDAKVYNVQSRVDEFIIGEYGTYTDGQTQHGVRYTAVADDVPGGVDPNLIYETLLKYFPMSVKGVDPPSSQSSASS